MNLKHHETADLGLVCVHIRVGNKVKLSGGWKQKGNSFLPWPKQNGTLANGTFPDYVLFTDISTVPVVWEFLRPYVKRGHHVYLATDTQEVSETWFKFGL